MENDTSQKIGRKNTPIDAGLQISVSVLLSILANNSLNHEGLLKYIDDFMTHRQTKMIQKKALSINVSSKIAWIFENLRAVSSMSKWMLLS